MIKEQLIIFSNHFNLTPREREVLELLVSRVTNIKELADQLKITPSTTSNHLKSVFEKTQTKGKSDLLALFLIEFCKSKKECKFFHKQPKVLIVDDEPELIDVIEDNLSDRGIQFYKAHSAIDALEKIKSINIDTVISDHNMPHMTGLELLKEIRKTHPYHPTFLIISANADVINLEELMESGGAALISKPIDYDKLFNEILECFILNDYDINRPIRVNTTVPAIATNINSSAVEDIGFGGIFLSINDTDYDFNKVSLGSKIHLNFNLDNKNIFSLGEVVWKRPHGSPGLKAGVGIKFINLSPTNRNHILEYVRLKKILSYIPIGKSEKLTAANPFYENKL